MYVEVRGQFAKVSSLLALCEAWGGIQGIRPDNNFLYLLSHPRKGHNEDDMVSER